MGKRLAALEQLGGCGACQGRGSRQRPHGRGQGRELGGACNATSYQGGVSTTPGNGGPAGSQAGELLARGWRESAMTGLRRAGSPDTEPAQKTLAGAATQVKEVAPATASTRLIGEAARVWGWVSGDKS